MARAGLRVPPGFTVTADACRRFFAEDGLGVRIDAVLDHDGSDEQAREAAARARALVEAAAVPADVAGEITAAYAALCTKVGAPDAAVAVRSSALAEDSGTASFAGEYESYLNCRGAQAAIDAVRRCWASLFTDRALVYQAEHGVDRASNAMAVVVQLMVDARVAGVMFTLNPLTGDPSRISIEANWGLGISVVNGEATPDHYLVDRIRMQVLERRISDKRVRYVPAPVDGDDGFVASEPVPDELREVPCLSDEEVIALAELGHRLHAAEGAPQDIEWALDARLDFPENLMIVQRRPETVHSQKRKAPVAAAGGAMSWIASTLIKGHKLD
jgi:pyruvate,water dikinase